MELMPLQQQSPQLMKYAEDDDGDDKNGNADGNDDSVDLLKLKIKCSHSEKTHDIRAFQYWTILQLKSEILVLTEMIGKRIRLIYQGRMLEDVHTLASCGLNHGSFVHAVISDPIPSDNDNETTVANTNNNANNTSSSTHRPRLPAQARAVQLQNDRMARLERLLEAEELSEEEVAELREHLLAANLEDFERVEMNQYNRLPWGMTEGSRAPEGTVADLFIGVVMGFTFGVIMVFCIFERSISSKQRLGIAIGVVIHGILGMARLAVASNPAAAAAAKHNSSSINKGN